MHVYIEKITAIIYMDIVRKDAVFIASSLPSCTATIMVDLLSERPKFNIASKTRAHCIYRTYVRSNII